MFIKKISTEEKEYNIVFYKDPFDGLLNFTEPTEKEIKEGNITLPRGNVLDFPVLIEKECYEEFDMLLFDEKFLRESIKKMVNASTIRNELANKFELRVGVVRYLNSLLMLTFLK